MVMSGVKCLKMELGEPDASGRRRPIPIKDSEFVIPADTMIAAVAQAPEISFLDESHGLEVTPKGTFAVDPLLWPQIGQESLQEEMWQGDPGYSSKRLRMAEEAPFPLIAI